MISSKKILFLDTTLHQNDATGITLSNLFGNFQKDNLYMIGDSQQIELSKHCGYSNFFSLGEEEIKHTFLIEIFKKIVSKFRKKRKNTDGDIGESNSITLDVRSDTKSSVIKIILDKLLKLYNKLGFHYLLKIDISSSLDKWIQKVDPDYIYVLLSTRHSIRFANNVSLRYNKPLIIHIMDDWPAVIGKGSLFSSYWNAKINKEFRELLNYTSKKIAISNMMAQEYVVRFGGVWEYFHNPVDEKRWFPFQKNIYEKSLLKKVRVAYFGRIAKANKKSIDLFVNSVDIFNKQLNEFIIEFHIYSYQYLVLPDSVDNIIQHSFLEFSKIPETMSEYDFLLLPLSFSKADIQFSRLSIPTKLSEYLVTGVPVISIVPEYTALSNFLIENECSFIINYDIASKIADELLTILNNYQAYCSISIAAKQISTKEFTSKNVLEKFDKIFNS